MKFVIYAPGDYTPNGGGCVALHKLAHNIASLGEESYIMTSKKNPDYYGIQINEIQAIQLCSDNQTMAIYPEVTCGNPFKSKLVTRWILYHVRTCGEFGIFKDTDLIYKYAADFKLRFDRPHDGELRAHELNLKTFTDRKLQRNGECFLIKKGNYKEHSAHKPDAIQLDNYPKYGLEANEYLAFMFNTCERFISYDTATWLNVMAALCGCESIVIPDDGVTANEWYAGYPYFKYGIAYGFDELRHASKTIKKLLPELLKIEKETLNETQSFINKAKSL